MFRLILLDITIKKETLRTNEIKYLVRIFKTLCELSSRATSQVEGIRGFCFVLFLISKREEQHVNIKEGRGLQNRKEERKEMH